MVPILSDDLVIGKEYCLDTVGDVRGVFLGIEKGVAYFKPTTDFSGYMALYEDYFKEVAIGFFIPCTYYEIEETENP